MRSGKNEPARSYNGPVRALSVFFALVALGCGSTAPRQPASHHSSATPRAAPARHDLVGRWMSAAAASGDASAEIDERELVLRTASGETREGYTLQAAEAPVFAIALASGEPVDVRFVDRDHIVLRHRSQVFFLKRHALSAEPPGTAADPTAAALP